jgi:asparagine N-glycosylation enzyme membrane subunit Stt3
MVSASLFQPTVRTHTPGGPGTPRPWNPRSVVFLAFFGGGVALAIISYLRAQRLGEARHGTWMMALAASATVLSMVGVAWWAGQWDDTTARNARLAQRIVGSVLALGFNRVLRSADRRAEMNGPPDAPVHDSLWKPGVLATLAGALTTGLMVATSLVLLEIPRA